VSRVRQLIADLVTEPPAATAPAASAQRIAF
jgi:hypothetical protein